MDERTEAAKRPPTAGSDRGVTLALACTKHTMNASMFFLSGKAMVADSMASCSAMLRAKDEEVAVVKCSA